mmetsp:Transcript_29669/g.67240  ORF Transcript_29669/g.67240 Transcript_29669/m.67240 type:complete len:106 (-) Transcript_29669:352-669(-)
MRGEQDDFREDYDAARGGKGAGLLKRLAEDPNRQVYVGKRKIDDSAVPCVCADASPWIGWRQKQKAPRRATASQAAGRWQTAACFFWARQGWEGAQIGRDFVPCS